MEESPQSWALEEPLRVHLRHKLFEVRCLREQLGMFHWADTVNFAPVRPPSKLPRHLFHDLESFSQGLATEV